MLNKIISFSLKNRPLILLLSLLLLVVGCWTAWRMEVDVFPDLNAPTVVVMTESKGMAAEEVERLVSFPIETAVSGATDVRRVRSSSSFGFSVVWVEFDWGTDIYRARQIVSEKLSTVEGSLPAGVDPPVLGPPSSILGEVYFIGLTADSTSTTDLRTIADRTLRPRLLASGGVAQVSILGGDIREYQVLLSPDRMRHYGVTLGEVLAATESMNSNVAGGSLYEHGNEYLVRGMLSTNNVEEIAQAVIKTDAAGRPILLADVAEVKLGAQEPRTGLASVSGKPAVLLTVTKQPSTSTLLLTQQLDSVVADFSRTLPADVKVNTDLYRQQRFIDASVSNIRNSLIEGGIFVVLVLFIFLMNARTTLISLVTIPLSLLVTIIVLRMMGLTINTMSIGGMAIAIGSLVDDAIVDVENVFRHIRLNRMLPEGERRPLLKVIYDASREVRLPILNSTLIIIVSFFPLFFLSGLEGRMLAPLGISFIVALFASTIVALTLTPVLCSYLLGGSTARSEEPKLVRLLKGGYSRVLGFVIRHGRAVLVVTGVLFVGALVGFFTLGRSFLPPFNEGSLTINVNTLPGVSLEESDRVGRRAEQILLEVPEVEAVARKTGRAELDEHALGINTSEMEVPFTLRDRTKEEMTTDIRQRLSALPGVNIEIGQPITHRIDAMLSGTKAAIAVKVFGTDLNRLYAVATEIKEAMGEVKGLTDVNVEQQVERPELVIRPRRTMLAAHGITLADFATYVETALAGKAVSQVFEEGRNYDITVKMNEDSRNGIEAVRSLLIDTGTGGKVTLGEVAEVTSDLGPNTISRENARRKIVVSAGVSGTDLHTAVSEIRRVIDEKVTMPDGYNVEFGGQFESEQAASRTITWLSVVSIAVILLLLFLQFRSWTQAVVVLLNLPLALMGGVAALLLSDGVVSIPAVIGFISLFGIATRGGMLLVDRYNELQREGFSKSDSVQRGSLDRLLPIIMTALTSALALIPLALGSDEPGNEIQSPMAKVILGGLLTGTFLNLIVIPIVYTRYISKKFTK